MPVIIQPCTKLNTALAAYRQSTNIRIVPIFPKSIPPVPPIFFIRPSDRAVVALPRTFGPTTENTVEHTAITATNIIAIL